MSGSCFGGQVKRLKERTLFSRRTHSLAAALQGKKPAVIAEIKKASPSKGILRHEFDHRLIGRQFVEGGASALSVLTDEDFFHGRNFYLEELSNSVSIPILRKDFIVDPYQVYESKAYGADAILLIAAALSPRQLADLHRIAEQLGLECLVEVHTQKEIEGLDTANVRIFGVNNRNLSTFETDLDISIRLKKILPSAITVVSESGISTAGDLKRLADHGIHAALIGETFMKADDPGDALRTLLREAGREQA